MRRISLIIIAIAFLSQEQLEALSGESSDCQTPHNQPGTCISIKTCPSLLQVFNKKPLSVENIELLKKSACGFEGRVPKVCCPKENMQSEAPSGIPMYFPSFRLDVHVFPSYPECGYSSRAMEQRIVGGLDAEIAEFPWLSLLGYKNYRGRLEWRCGGSLISDRYVLTAAHCIYIRGLLLSIVRLGEHTISNEPKDCIDGICAPRPKDIEVEYAFVHPLYEKPVRLKNDIGLIRLKKSVKFSNYIRPICLPFGNFASSNLENLRDMQFYVAGWGYTRFGMQKMSDVLQKLDVPVVPLNTCQRRYRNGIRLGPEQVCAGGSVNRDFCMGDSGGPLMLMQFDGSDVIFRIVGVVSAGTVDCGDGSAPGVYTRVGSYLTWISDNVEL